MSKIYVTGPYRRIANLIALGRTIAREPDYVSHRPSTQITNISTGGGDYVDTGGGDYASEDIDKRQITHTNQEGIVDSDEIRSQPPRAHDVEQCTLEFLLRYEEAGRPSVLAGSGVWVGDTTIAEELLLDIQLIRDSLENLAERGCAQLKLFMGGPHRLVASLTGRGRTIAREPDSMPAASPIPTLYDQPGWQADTVYNVAGNVYGGPTADRQAPVGLEVADMRFELKSACGIATCLEVRNWTDRAKKVYVFVYPQSEEPLIPLNGNSLSLNPTVIDAEDTKEIRVPLRLGRVDPSKRPLIVSVEVRDALGRKTFVPDELIERLNAQIAGQWPYPETE